MLVRRWVASWLKAYAIESISPSVSIQELLEKAPVVTSHWNFSRKDESLFRFG